MSRATLGKLSMPGFRPLPVPGLITAGCPIPPSGSVLCIQKRATLSQPPGRTLELTVFWLFDGAIKAFDYDVPVFLGELLLQRGGRGFCHFFMWLEVPTFPVLPLSSQCTHFFARLPTWWCCCCCCAVSLVLVWCFIIYSLPRDVHWLFRHFAALSHFIRIFGNIPAILVSSRICGVIYASFTSSGMWSLLAVFLAEEPDEFPS